MKLTELEKPILAHPEALLGANRRRLSAWDVVYSLNMAIACVIAYRTGSEGNYDSSELDAALNLHM